MEFSSSSSDEEYDEENEHLKTLANLVFQKLKNDGVVSKLQSLQKEEENKLEKEKIANIKKKKKRKQRKKRIVAETSSSSCNTSSGVKSLAVTNIKDIYRQRAEKALKDSRIYNTHIEKLEQVLPHQESERQKKKQAKAARASLSSKGWGAMKAKEKPTDKEKSDLMVLQMRATIDPQRHYKHTDIKAPKFFQFGKILDSPLDFHHRVPKKLRKKTMVEELMADMEFRKQTKRKYLETVELMKKRGAVYQGKPPKRLKKSKKDKK